MFHMLHAYCIFESNQASRITLSEPRLNNKAPLCIIIINSKPLLLVWSERVYFRRLLRTITCVCTSRLSLYVDTYPSNHELFVPKQLTAHLPVFGFCILAGVFGDYSQLFPLFHLINFVGVGSISISSFSSIIISFVWRENPEKELKFKKYKFSDATAISSFLIWVAASGEEDSMFVAKTASLLDLFPELGKEDTSV